ncbi:hypothetical protein [Agathobaculum desmolans]|uniref:hypothetical protein n=1 Tax=Agathobaculum desmolans TaxID=39484 RepID=UPI0004E0B3CE|nr:hypothetical protein [Agathobaculum desmolans]
MEKIKGGQMCSNIHFRKGTFHEVLEYLMNMFLTSFPFVLHACVTGFRYLNCGLSEALYQFFAVFVEADIFLIFFAILFSFVPQAIIGKRLHLKRIESTYNAIALFAGLASLYMYVDMKDSKAVFDETLGFSFFVLWLIFILLGALICIYRNLEKRKK